jgi:hypothetical protein
MDMKMRVPEWMVWSVIFMLIVVTIVVVQKEKLSRLYSPESQSLTASTESEMNSKNKVNVLSIKLDRNETYAAYAEGFYGPPGIIAPGGNGLPVMTMQSGEEAPQISAISDITYPDETLAITGNHLEGTKLRIWAEGGIYGVTPIQSSNDRMFAVVPSELPVSAMLVWPVKEGEMGKPIRVNTAEVSWGWPARAKENVPGQTVRVFGKNLKVGHYQPVMYMMRPDGKKVQLSIMEGKSNPYQLEAKLPEDLSKGMYTVWAHNGSGGPFGWSESVTFEVVGGDEGNLSVFRVDDYGADPTDKLDDYNGIIRAIEAAKKGGGGIVQFSAGNYHVSQAIKVEGEASKGIHLVGAGMGDHSWKHGSTPFLDDHRLSGTYTSISWVDGEEDKVIAIKNMTLWNGDSGLRRTPEFALRIHAQDVIAESVRAIMVDARDATSSETNESLILGSAIYIDVPGKDANIVIKDSEIHAVAGGILIGTMDSKRVNGASTNYIRIDNVKVRGYFAGQHPRDLRISNEKGGSSQGGSVDGVIVQNGKNIILENSDFAAADAYNGKILSRMFMSWNNRNRDAYVANNRTYDLGTNPSGKNIGTNYGEQILFHYLHLEAYPAFGGQFEIVRADPNSLTVDLSNIKPFPKGLDERHVKDNTGSQLLGELVEEQAYVAFVKAGKGVGQFRIINDLERDAESAKLSITEPWRIVPDETSKVSIEPLFRNNIIYGNDLDTGKAVPGYKTIGVTFYHKSFNNIVANNTLKHFSLGVAFVVQYRGGSGWNLARDNVMEDMTGDFTSSTANKPAFYSILFSLGASNSPAFSENKLWISVGNIFRSNKANSGTAAASIDTLTANKKRLPEEYLNYEDKDGGIMLPIIENNVFEQVRQGINIERPANWTLIRNNTIQIKDRDTPPIVLNVDRNKITTVILP